MTKINKIESKICQLSTAFKDLETPASIKTLFKEMVKKNKNQYDEVQGNISLRTNVTNSSPAD